MKQKLLAIAIPALLIAGSANASIEIWNKDGNKVDLNGRIKASNHVTDRNQVHEGDRSDARIGIRGATQITDSLSGYGRWEWQTYTGKNAFDETRYAFAGLNFNNYGSFDYGRNDGVLKAITAYTDVLPEFGGDAADNSLYTLSGRTKAVATYRNNDLFGLTKDVSFALQYADNGDNSSTKDGKDNGSREAIGANVQWSIFDSGVKVIGGYAQTTGTGKTTNFNAPITGDFNTVKQVKTWGAALKYDGSENQQNNLYLAASYFQSQVKQSEQFDDYKIKGLELVAQYGLDLDVGRLTPSLAYVQHKVDSDSFYEKYVAIGTSYEFNKNFTALVEYKVNLLDKDDIGAYLKTKDIMRDGNAKAGTKDTLGLALIYQF